VAGKWSLYIYIHMYTAIRHTVKARPKNISCSNLKHGDSKSNPTMCRTVWAQNAKSEGLYMVVMFLFACWWLIPILGMIPHYIWWSHSEVTEICPGASMTHGYILVL
jgi:hypothetical protein